MCDTEPELRVLEISTNTKTEGILEVTVRDSGLGISTENENQIFDAFFSTRAEGLGMGLAISRSIVAAHGGRLWMAHNSDRGVTFRFTLPLATPEDS